MKESPHLLLLPLFKSAELGCLPGTWMSTLLRSSAVCVCCGLIPASNQAPWSCSLTPPPPPDGMGRRMGKKVKLVGWDKDSLIRTSKEEVIKYKTSDAQCSYSPPDDWYQAYPWAVIAAPWPTPPSLYTEHDVIWYGIFPGTGRVRCPSCVPVSEHLAGQASVSSWKILDCLATTKNVSMLSTLFESQIQNRALHQLPGRKLTLSQLQPGQHFPLLKRWELPETCR